MSSAILYRISAVLLLLFAVGHPLGFRKVDPRWGVATLVDGLKSTYFDVQGARRTYWDFFSGFGFFVTVLLLFSAVLAWQLAALPAATLASLRVVLWAFAACYVIIAVLTWRYFFMAPVVFSVLVGARGFESPWLRYRSGTSSVEMLLPNKRLELTPPVAIELRL